MLEEETTKKRQIALIHENELMEKKNKIDKFKNSVWGEEIRSSQEKLSKLTEKSLIFFLIWNEIIKSINL